MKPRPIAAELSAALDGELDAAATRELLDVMATDPGCRGEWRRLRANHRELAPLVRPARRPLAPRATAPRRRPATRWIATAATAAVLALALLWPVGNDRGLPAVDGSALNVKLASHEGRMSEARFVQLVVEVLEADPRYQQKMLEVLQEVRPLRSLAEAGSPEAAPASDERLVLGPSRDAETPVGELPFGDRAGIH